MQNIYRLEEQSTYYGPRYRFVSLYNGARGPWTFNKEKAETHGIEHQKIILLLHGTITPPESEVGNG